jgi:anti-sigma regulatory factor (Ser/Thr protein kinase)
MTGLSWERVFPGEAQQVAAVRRWITSLLPACPSRADLVLVASELAGNAIRHTASGQGGTFAVRVAWGGDTALVAVADAGGPGEPRVLDDPAAEGGRGLLVVRELSARLTVSGTGAGRQVCAEIAWQDPAAPVTGRAWLGSRFGVPAWYGSCTRQWWALAGGQLLSAPSVPELAVLITRSGLAGPAPPVARSPRCKPGFLRADRSEQMTGLGQLAPSERLLRASPLTAWLDATLDLPELARLAGAELSRAVRCRNTQGAV